VIENKRPNEFSATSRMKAASPYRRTSVARVRVCTAAHKAYAD